MGDGFTFMHAADLHLDSPLLGLSARAPDLATRVDQASRRAFDRLVDLAVEQRCAFVILAGDTFDGDLRDYRTALHFLSGMARLRDAGVGVYIVAGNHDAENRFFGKLPHADNVRLFRSDAAHTFLDDRLRVALHGRSFAAREVAENLAAGYPAPHPTYLNVGVLHTACQGGEGGRAAYAPCTLEQLVNHGYDYWALGHVHARRVLSERPYVVYPGNVQGRDPREAGPRGVTLVRVASGTIRGLDHRDLDEVRWARAEADLTGAATVVEALSAVRSAAAAAAGSAGGRPLALRLALVGETPLHAGLARDRAALRDEVEAIASTLRPAVWLERVEVLTRPLAPAEGTDPTVAGRLAGEVRRLAAGADAAALVERCLEEVRVRMPAGARFEELAARVRRNAASRAADVALAVLDAGEGGDEVR